MSGFDKLLMFVVLFCISYKVSADAMPKGYQQYQFDIKTKVDSILVQESDVLSFNVYDTLKSHWVNNYIICQDNSCRFVGHAYKKYQRLLLFSGGRQITLPVYEPVGSNPTFVVSQVDGNYKIQETTSFLFRGKTGEILRALSITLFLELLTAAYVFGNQITKKKIRLVTLMNCISLPLAWLSFDAVSPYIDSWLLLILGLELIIFVSEFLFLRYFLKEISPIRLFNFSLVANAISFIIGGFLYIVSTFL
ncbi:hypothetical protein ACLI08_10980 [Flavobacterium sp. RNTU_13]|uniref:hypothetical protein n=1 Tax=Flavobacterium sp. RNTU_13 TaxID=3375145 RepID=UPI003985C2E9